MRVITWPCPALCAAVTPAGPAGVAEVADLLVVAGGSWWPRGLVRKDLPDLAHTETS